MKRPSKKLHEIARKIGIAFLEKHKFDYDKNRDFVYSLLITDIKDGDSITIETARPVLVIGRKGENIDLLEKKLGRKVEIVESFTWPDWIAPISSIEEEDLRQETEAYYAFSKQLEKEANS